MLIRRLAAHLKRSQLDSEIAPSKRPASVSPADRRVQVAAAKARITLDKLTGDQTEEWIIALSKEKPE